MVSESTGQSSGLCFQNLGVPTPADGAGAKKPKSMVVSP